MLKIKEYKHYICTFKAKPHSIDLEEEKREKTISMRKCFISIE